MRQARAVASGLSEYKRKRDFVALEHANLTGSDLTVSTNSTDSVFLNVPDAGTAARGVVTTGTQTFGGNKAFQDSVNAAKAVLVGTSGNANSTVQVAGSLSLASAFCETDVAQ